MLTQDNLLLFCFLYTSLTIIFRQSCENSSKRWRGLIYPWLLYFSTGVDFLLATVKHFHISALAHISYSPIYWAEESGYAYYCKEAERVEMSGSTFALWIYGAAPTAIITVLSRPTYAASSDIALCGQHSLHHDSCTV